MKKLILLSALTVALVLAGCDTCEKTEQTINDLTRAQTLLGDGLRDQNWPQTCDTLIQSAEVFRSDADFVRSVADQRYSGMPAGCIDRGYVDYCRGGWGRYPYPYGAVSNDDQLNSWLVASAEAETMVDSNSLAVTIDQPGHGGGHPQPRPAPHPQPRPMPQPRPAPYPQPRPVPHPYPQPRPVPHPVPQPRPVPHPVPQPRPRPPVVVYPPHYRPNPHWHWRYEPRYCSVVPVCYRWSSGQPQHPGYEQVLALAYELDQAAGGIETACRKAFEGAPVEEINTVARETLTRIEQHGLPGVRNIYSTLGCARRGD